MGGFAEKSLFRPQKSVKFHAFQSKLMIICNDPDTFYFIQNWRKLISLPGSRALIGHFENKICSKLETFRTLFGQFSLKVTSLDRGFTRGVSYGELSP